jgi:hypothetical protein
MAWFLALDRLLQRDRRSARRPRASRALRFEQLEPRRVLSAASFADCELFLADAAASATSDVPSLGGLLEQQLCLEVGDALAGQRGDGPGAQLCDWLAQAQHEWSSLCGVLEGQHQEARMAWLAARDLIFAEFAAAADGLDLCPDNFNSIAEGTGGEGPPDLAQFGLPLHSDAGPDAAACEIAALWCADDLEQADSQFALTICQDQLLPEPDSSDAIPEPDEASMAALTSAIETTILDADQPPAPAQLECDTSSDVIVDQSTHEAPEDLACGVQPPGNELWCTYADANGQREAFDPRTLLGHVNEQVGRDNQPDPASLAEMISGVEFAVPCAPPDFHVFGFQGDPGSVLESQGLEQYFVDLLTATEAWVACIGMAHTPADAFQCLEG